MTGITKLSKINIINATKQHTASLFFFHGSGSSGDEVKEWIDILNREEFKFPHIKILYPSAPPQPYTAFNGMVSNVWFDRKRISINVPEQVDSIDSMCNIVSELIDKEVSDGIPDNRIAVGGFSMGGALAFHLAYRIRPTLAGCVAMSSFLNKNSVVYEHLKANPEARRVPLLQFHGLTDDLVPIKWGEETYKTLTEHGVKSKFVPLNSTNHELVKTEIDAFRQWLLDILPEK